MNPLELEASFLRLSPRLRAFLDLRIPAPLRAKVSSEDLLQDVWILARRSLGEFVPRDEASVNAWLTRIARNVLSDRIRQGSRAKRSGSHRRVGNSRNSSILGAFRSCAAAEPSPSKEVRHREVELKMIRALARLPDNRRQALQLKYIEGVPTVEIAARMGKSESAVRGLVAEGLRQLRQAMGDPSIYFSDDALADDNTR